jgi:hypothetical protein
MANDISAFIPEVWAQESLAILEENTVAANLVNRDFEDRVANFGDVVNTRSITKVEADRWQSGDISLSDITSTNVAVPLDQLGVKAFIINDKDMSMSMSDLFATYLKPHVQAIARQIDETLINQKYQFLTNCVGKIGTALTKDSAVAVDKFFTDKNANGSRYALLSAAQKADLLGETQFTDAYRLGDGGSALRAGSLGELYGTNWLVAQNNKTVASGNTTITAAVNHVGGYAAGTTAIVIDSTSTAGTAGGWCTIAGDMTPQRITSCTTTALVISPGLRNAVANDAVVTFYTPGTVNLSAGYAAGFIDPIVTGTFSVAPQKGQLVSFGTGTSVYGAIGTPTTTSLKVDRPLAVALTNSEIVGVGPAGNYGFAFTKDALALVSRPLALSPAGAGATSYVASYNGLSVRVSFQQDLLKSGGGMIVKVDTLYGVKALNTDAGCVILS